MIPERFMVTGKQKDTGDTLTGHYWINYIGDVAYHFIRHCGEDYEVDPETVEPVAVKVSVDDDNVLCCPNCKGRVMEFTEYNYCLICGQRLDWGD